LRAMNSKKMRRVFYEGRVFKKVISSLSLEFNPYPRLSKIGTLRCKHLEFLAGFAPQSPNFRYSIAEKALSMYGLSSHVQKYMALS
jgi:hypothetical protein